MITTRVFFFDYECFRPKVQLLKDIRRINEKDIDGVYAIVHLAALSNDATGELDPELTFEINKRATVRLAQLARKRGIKRFIYASSCSVYGICDSESCANEKTMLEPLTAYAKAKVDAEAELIRLQDKSFNVTIMRNATMHGLSPKLRLDLVVNNLCAYAKVYDKVKILSDGTPWRPLLSVVDFAQAVLVLLQNEPHHNIYNVGFNAENYQIKTLGEVISEITGAKLEINRDKTPDERSYRVDFSRFESEFPEFRIKLPVRDSIAELMEGYRRYGLTKDDFLGPKYFRIRTLKELFAKGVLNSKFEKG